MSLQLTRAQIDERLGLGLAREAERQAQKARDRLVASLDFLTRTKQPNPFNQKGRARAFTKVRKALDASGARAGRMRLTDNGTIAVYPIVNRARDDAAGVAFDILVVDLNPKRYLANDRAVTIANKPVAHLRLHSLQRSAERCAWTDIKAMTRPYDDVLCWLWLLHCTANHIPAQYLAPFALPLGPDRLIVGDMITGWDFPDPTRVFIRTIMDDLTERKTNIHARLTKALANIKPDRAPRLSDGNTADVSKDEMNTVFDVIEIACELRHG